IASCCTVFRSSCRFFAKRWSSERNQKKMTLMSPKSADIAIPHAHRLVSASTTLIARQATLRHFQNEACIAPTKIARTLERFEPRDLLNRQQWALANCINDRCARLSSGRVIVVGHYSAPVSIARFHSLATSVSLRYRANGSRYPADDC